MDVRGPSASHILSKMCDLLVARFRELVSSGAGGFVLMLPANIGQVAGKCREAVLVLEQKLSSSEMDIPVYSTEVKKSLNEVKN